MVNTFQHLVVILEVQLARLFRGCCSKRTHNI